MMAAPMVTLVILNWNNAPDTIECLESASLLDYPNYRVLVVDNGSTDGSASRIRTAHADVEIIETGENLGYAGGNNVGVRRALTRRMEYICILNNDVKVAPDFLTELVSALEDSAGAGIATPLVAEMERSDRVWALGQEVEWMSGKVMRLHAGEDVSAQQSKAAFEVDVASGAAMLVKSEVFEHAGLLEELFYLYYEEVDWCLRVRREGYRILAVPSSLLWHRVSATLGPTSPVIDYYMLRNHLRMIGHHRSGASRLWLLTRIVLRSLVTIAAYTTKPHGGKRLPHRNSRLLALRDALLGRWGKMGPDVEAVCYPDSQ
jgi:GT2 family glycosyltransferase